MKKELILHMDDLLTLKSLESLILSKREKLFTKPKADEGLVMIVSGGLDSTIALKRVLEDFECSVYPLYVKRGARAEAKELASVLHYLEIFKADHHNLKELEILEEELPPKRYKQYIPESQLNSIGHTLRNAVLQSFGVQYAVAAGYRDDIRIKTVFTSLSPDDDVPHCRLVAVRAETILTCIDSADWSWQVTSPLLEDELWGWVDKAECIEYAFKNGLALDHTYTCTDSSDTACGMCSACETRLKVFAKSGYADPIAYKQQATK